MIKLILKNAPKGLETEVTIGKEYEIKNASWGSYLIFITDNNNECSFVNSLFETVLQSFERKVKETKVKFVVSQPGGKYTPTIVDLILIDGYYVVYSHTKGTHYNIFGNQYRYFHDFNTGEYVPTGLLADGVLDKLRFPIIKERILLADFKRLNKIAKENYALLSSTNI